MPDPLADIFRSQFKPLEPIPTGERSVLADLQGIRAVLFDLYGTLFISASGEVGATKEAAPVTQHLPCILRGLVDGYPNHSGSV